MNNFTLHEKIIAYYKAAYSQRADSIKWPIPDYVPSRVAVKKTINGEEMERFLCSPCAGIAQGEYVAECDKYGAVMVDTPNGKLGLKLDEFDIVEMIENPKKGVN